MIRNASFGYCPFEMIRPPSPVALLDCPPRNPRLQSQFRSDQIRLRQTPVPQAQNLVPVSPCRFESKKNHPTPKHVSAKHQQSSPPTHTQTSGHQTMTELQPKQSRGTEGLRSNYAASTNLKGLGKPLILDPLPQVLTHLLYLRSKA